MTEDSEQTSSPGMDLDPDQDKKPAARLQVSIELPESTRVRVTVETSRLKEGEPDSSTGEPPAVVVVEHLTQPGRAISVVYPPEGALPRPASLPRRLWWRASGWLERLLVVRRRANLLVNAPFIAALLIYLLARLVGLVDFPIYFFTDEAIQTVSAADLVSNSFRGPDNEFLPTYFKNGSYYNLSISVYLQVIPYLIFGKSVFVTRATAVLVTLIAAAAIGLALRDIFKVRYWWSGPLLLSLAPAWFLHSRTAFETGVFVSFYAGALYGYFLYRCRSARYLHFTLVMAALAFYSYSPGQVIVAVTGILLLFSDARYHWQNRREVLKGMLLLAILALPYLRFRLTHATAPLDHLRDLGSYWVKPIPLNEKLVRFSAEYLYGLSPKYWFFPHGQDLPRHVMKDYGYMMGLTLPFALLGLLLVLRSFRSSASRVVLAALLASPAGTALVGIGITRVLVFVVPATLLTAIGLSQTMEWLEKLGDRLWEERLPGDQARGKPPAATYPVGVFAVLALANFSLLRDAVVNGPTWYDHYGLGGMQYGATQLFPAVLDYLEEHPGTRMIVSPSWSNGTDIVARFFVPDPLPFEMGSIEGFFYQHLPLDENTVFVMIPGEFEKVYASEKFEDLRVELTLPYPNGQPGFYFVRLRYADRIDQILERERQQRRQLQESEVMIAGLPVHVRYSMLDMGDIHLMFDGDPHSVARTFEANPLVIELNFPEVRTFSGISVIVGSSEVRITTRLYLSPESAPVEFTHMERGTVERPQIGFEFARPTPAQLVYLEIFDPHQAEPAHIHVWEIDLR